MVRTRGNTPQAQVAAVAPVAQMRAKRTRSQSVEPSTSTSTASQTAKPRTARLGGPLQRTSSSSSSRAVNNRAAQKDLSIVEERDASDAENEPAETATTPPRTVLSPNANPRVSISGTTAHSTVSSEDDEIGPEPERLLLEIAPDLCTAAARVIKVLTIPNSRTKTKTIEDILRELEKPGSITAKKLWPLQEGFSTLFHQFVDNDKDDFLDPQKIIEDIFAPHSLPAPDSKSWGIAELIYGANLAYLGKWVVNAQISEPEKLDFLKTLNETCPQPFLASLMEGSAFGDSELQDETFEIVLAVRAQLAVTRLIAEDELDHEIITQVIRSVFYAPLESGGYSERTLNVWNFNGIGAGATGLLPEYEKEIRKSVAAIEAGARLDMERLTSELSWSAFCLKVVKWIHERQQELDGRISRLGGQDTIFDAVKQELGLEATILEPSPNKFDSFGSTLAVKSPKKSKIPNFAPFLARMENFKKRRSGVGVEQQANDATTPEVERRAEPEVVPEEATRHSLPSPEGLPAPVAQPAAEAEHNSRSRNSAQRQRQPTADVVVADDFTPIENYEEDVVEPEPGPSKAPRLQAPPATQGKALIKNYQAKRRQDKENRGSQPARPRAFIDPQEEAVRVEFDEETQERQSQQVASRRPGSVSRGKRPAPVEAEEDEDVSQDEGFQTDSRDIGNRSQRRPPAPVAPQSNGRPDQPSPPKRARIASQTTRTSNTRAPRGPSPGLESEEDEPDSTNYQQVKAIARRNVAMAKMGVERKRRKAWTGAEEAQLQSLIADYGTSWTELKKMDEADGNLLADRDQVALKDKARNMKMAFLKARVDLPANFEDVPLDKKGRDMLDALGIDY